MGFGNFHSLLDIIKRAQEKHPGFSKRLGEAEALGRWEIAVGAQIARHARAIRVYNSILFVEVDHPAWKSELHYRKNQILDILNGITPCTKAGFTSAIQPLKDIVYLEPQYTRR